MKRKFLEDLGLSKEVMDKIMDENGKDVETEKARTDAKDKELATANQTIKDLQDTVKKFDGKDPEKLQHDLDDLQEKYNTDIAAEKVKAENLQKEYGLRDVLKGSGVTDPDYLIYKHGGLDKFTFDKEGKPVGVDDLLKPYKADKAMAHLFKQEDRKPPYEPNGGGGGGTANPFAKETFNMTEQGKLLKENPEQARSMAAAAGVKI